MANSYKGDNVNVNAAKEIVEEVPTMPTRLKRKIRSDEIEATTDDGHGPYHKIAKCWKDIDNEAYQEMLDDNGMLLGYKRKISGDKTNACDDNVPDPKTGKSLDDKDNDVEDEKGEEQLWDDDALSIGSEVIVDDLDELGGYEHRTEERDELEEEKGKDKQNSDDSHKDFQEAEEIQEKSTHRKDGDMHKIPSGEDSDDSDDDFEEVEQLDDWVMPIRVCDAQLEEDILNKYLDDTTPEEATEQMKIEGIFECQDEEEMHEKSAHDKDGDKDENCESENEVESPPKETKVDGASNKGAQEIRKDQDSEGDLDQDFINKFLDEIIQEISVSEKTYISKDIAEFDYAEFDKLFNAIVPYEENHATGDSASQAKLKDVSLNQMGVDFRLMPDFDIEMPDNGEEEEEGEEDLNVGKMMTSFKTCAQTVISEFNFKDLAAATMDALNNDGERIMTVVDQEDREGKEDCTNAEVPLSSILQYDSLKKLHTALDTFSKDIVDSIVPSLGNIEARLDTVHHYFSNPNMVNYFNGIIPQEEVSQALADEKPLYLVSLNKIKFEEKYANTDDPYLDKFFKKILLEDADPKELKKAIELYNKNHPKPQQADRRTFAYHIKKDPASFVKAEEVKEASTSFVKAEEVREASTSFVKAEKVKEAPASFVKAEEVKEASTSFVKAEEVKEASTSFVKAEEVKEAFTSFVKAEEVKKASTSPAKGEEVKKASTSPAKGEEVNKASTSPAKGEEANEASASSVKPKEEEDNDAGTKETPTQSDKAIQTSIGTMTLDNNDDDVIEISDDDDDEVEFVSEVRPLPYPCDGSLTREEEWAILKDLW